MGLTRRLHGDYETNVLSSKHIQERALSEINKVDGDDSILPVLIVGAGPVGLVLAILLTKLGVKCAVLEKQKAFSTHPQAHVINNRSMEVFRKLDGLVDDILRSQPPVDSWRNIVYCTSLTGRVLGSVDHVQSQDFDQVVSPAVSISHLKQYKLNELLINKLGNLGFHIENSEGVKEPLEIISEGKILMRHECISIKTADHGVTATISFEREGKRMEKDIHCNFLIGTDGARSTIRKLIGINMEGERNMQNHVGIHFFSQGLGRYLINKSPGILFFIFNPEAICFVVAYDLRQGEFVLQVPYYPPQQKLEDFSPKMCERLISKLVGRELADLNVINIKPWVLQAQVAEKFLSCDNRVILAGDAAHRFTPAGGFGMNTGIQDAHNLAWKLASVLEGMAPASFLSTYEMERKPIASFNTALSIQNFKVSMEVNVALGLDPTIRNAVYRGINGVIASILPSWLQRAILLGMFRVFSLQLSDFVLNEKNPLGYSMLTKLKQIFESGESLQLQFPAEDLGFKYLQGALVCEGNSMSNASESPTGRRKEYVPSSEPGSRLPHMNVRPLSNLSSKDTLSTLDLVSVEKVEFILIIAPIKESYDLAQAAFMVAEGIKVPLKVCVVWPENTINGNGTSDAPLMPWKNFIDVVEIKRSPTSPSWWNLCKMTNRGAILVRPDEHIAWRSKSGNINEPILEMKQVFGTIFGLDASNA